MNETETRAKLIDPALHARGWTEDLIRREVTAGRIYIHGNGARQSKNGRADYTLRVKAAGGSQPVAVALIEAKKASLPPAHGLDQAKAYADSKRLNVPFVYSTNGSLFVEYDSTTGITAPPRPIDQFPTPDDLRARYEAAVGFSLDDEEARPLLVPYHGGETSRRYYQDAAIRAVLERVARQQKAGEPPRALVSMATGSGKTRIAVNLLRRLADAGRLRRALFVVDRDELKTQALGALQAAFGSDVRVVSTDDPQKNARILVATYQTLGIAEGADGADAATASFLAKHYPEDYFSHIVIDEAHRSAWGKWSEVLRRNAAAVQVGLTATPRKLRTAEVTEETKQDEKITADNRAYFGEPVYEYTIGQAVADGYLAACEVRRGRVNLDESGLSLDEIMAKNPTDAITGRTLTEAEVRERYEAGQFESAILLPDRVAAMTDDLFRYLVETGGPEQKTVVFCVRDNHADDVAIALNNLYTAYCAQRGIERKERFAFKCTAAHGSEELEEFRGSRSSHYIATTVDLLSTGVDVPAIRNIAFFRYIRSPILFYQMVGRGTRLDPSTGKLMFRVYDYTNATRLFGEEFITDVTGTEPDDDGGDDGGTDSGGDARAPLVTVGGFDVAITDEGRFVPIYRDGRDQLVSLEEYKELVAEALLSEVPTVDDLRARWVDPQARQLLLAGLPEEGQSVRRVQALEDMDACDLYDVLAELGYGIVPRTRLWRAGAFEQRHADWLADLPARTAATLRALTARFAVGGIDALESRSIFSEPEVEAAGGLDALMSVGKPAELLRETKSRIFAP